jgi:hypothetical protein
MPNLNRPQGLRPIGKILQTKVFEAGSAVYPQDPVRLAADGQVDRVAAGNTILGVALNAAAAGESVLVSIAKEQTYEIQASDGGVDAQAAIGQVADLVMGTASTAYKIARCQLNVATLDTSSAQLVILDITNEVGETFGSYAKCVVQINEPQLVYSFAGI